ncbi:MAG: MATE family efflux transporter [Alphaproteobacteria bacterium]|nr:MATE family efflux transporter [Alphaproteobacteria bacterium]
MSSRDLTRGPIPGHLLRLAGPMGFGIFAIMAFNLVDTWFVSKLGTQALAAMTLTFPVVMLVGSVAMGLGVGVTSVLSRAIGNGRHEEVQRLTTHTLLLGVALVVAISVVGLILAEPMLRGLGGEGEVLELAASYLRIWFAGAGVVVVPMLGMSAIRAAGDTRTPAVVMSAAGVANGVLDPLFIFGLGPIPAMGLEGAAIATVASRAVTLVVALWVLHAREGLLRFSWDDLGLIPDSWGRVLLIGGPAAFTNLTQPLTIGFLTGLAAGFGEPAVAAFGAGGRVEMFALIPAMAMAMGLAPFVGQNHGAGDHPRVAEAVSLSLRVTIAMGVLSFGVLALFRDPLAAVFTDDPAVLPLLARYLWILPLSHVLVGAFFVATNTLNAVGRPLPATVLTLLRTPILLGGGAWLGASVGGLTGFFWGSSVGLLASGALGLLAMVVLGTAARSEA